MRGVSFIQPNWLLRSLLLETANFIEMTSAKVFEILGFRVCLVLFEIESKTQIVNEEEIFDPEEKYYFISSSFIRTQSEVLDKLLTQVKLKGIM